MMADRRSFLGLLAVGLAGCSQEEEPDSRGFQVEYTDQGAFESIEVVASVDGQPATIGVETVVDTSGQQVVLSDSNGRQIEDEPGRILIPEYPMAPPVQVVLVDGDGGVIGRAVITGGSA